MSRRILARHPYQFEDVTEYTTMRRYLAESSIPRDGRYNFATAIYPQNLRSVAFTAFAAISNQPLPPCLETLLSGGDPFSVDYTLDEDGGFYDTDTFGTTITGGDPDTNFCEI